MPHYRCYLREASGAVVKAEAWKTAWNSDPA